MFSETPANYLYAVVLNSGEDRRTYVELCLPLL